MTGLCGLLLAARPLYGFDNDFEIEHADFQRVNMVDIKSYEFGKRQDDSWYETENGWRYTSGSLDYHRLYEWMGLRLKSQLSDTVSVKIRSEYEHFYEILPQAPLNYEIEWQASEQFAASFVGATSFDKRTSDMGLAATFGQWPWRYLRITALGHDALYNSKNPFDDNRYEKLPWEGIVEGGYARGNYKTRFSYSRDLPLEWHAPDEGLIFKHNADRYELVVDRMLDGDSLVGFKWRGFIIDKSRQSPSEDRDQRIDYESLDIYWLRPLADGSELTLGVREDVFRDETRNRLTTAENFDYSLETRQAYVIHHRPWTTHFDFDYALYFADSRLLTDYLNPARADKEDTGWDGKFRLSLEYHSLDRRRLWRVHTSANLDNLDGHPWDGGGMTFQMLF